MTDSVVIELDEIFLRDVTRSEAALLRRVDVKLLVYTAVSSVLVLKDIIVCAAKKLLQTICFVTEYRIRVDGTAL